MQDPKTGLFIASKVQPLSNVSPVNQTYENWPAFRERTLAFSQMPYGFGHQVQLQDNPEQDGFYYYADCADLSILTMWQKGPAITVITPTTTGSILKFEEMTISSTKTLFAIAGNYVLQRNGDTAATWPVSKNLGAAATGGIVLAQNVSSAPTRLMVAMGPSTESWYTADGVSWAQTTNGVKMNDFAMIDRQLFGASGVNQVTDCDIAADYTNFSDWGPVDLFRVGDASKSVTRLAKTTHNALVVVKEDGIWTIADDGQPFDLFPGLRAGSDLNNGYGWFLFEDTLYLPTINTGLLGITPAGYFGTIAQAKEVGVEKIGDNSSPVRGRITAGEGSQFNAYAGLWNPDTNESYVIKYGTRTTNPSDPLVPSWHGSISHAFAGVKITAMKRSTVGAPANHERMYLGFSDGSIGWFTLPCTTNPAGCSSYTYELTDCYIYLPTAHLGFKADNKNIAGASIFGPNLGADHYAKVAFRADMSSAWTFTGGDPTNGSSYMSDGGSRYDLTTPILTRAVDTRVTLTSTQQTTSPQVSALAIHHTVVPALVLEYQGTVDARPFTLLRDGRPSRLPPQAIKDAMQTAAGNPTSTWILPTEDSVTVQVHEYSYVQEVDVRTKRIGWLIPFKAVAYKTNTVYGTWARIQQNSWSALNGMTWASLQTL